MHVSKFLSARWVAVIGVAIVPGFAWLSSSRNEAGRDSKPLQGNAWLPTKEDRVEAGGSKYRKPRADTAAIKLPHAFTSDELAAIYESRGAAAATAAAMSMTGHERESQVVFILTYLARIDPEFVAGELKGVALNTTHQRFIVDAVMNEWKDGKKALEWATSNFTGDLLKTAAGGALRILVRTDPPAALAYLDTLSAGGSRRQAISDLFTSWGGCDPKAALNFLSENFPADDRSSAITSVIAGWTWTRPTEAAAWVEAVQDETLRTRLVSEVARSLRSKSPAEATAWVESLPEGPSKEAGKAVCQETVITTITGMPAHDSWKTKTVATMDAGDFWNWRNQDPEGARKFLETNPDGKDLAELASAVASGISYKEGPEAAFDWAQTLQGEAAKKALRLAVISWADSDPAAAAKKLEALAPEQRAPLATDLAENWAQNDPAAAAAWVATYDGAEQKALVREVLQKWTDSQPREAYAWLATLPMGPGRDDGINYLMRREASSDPKSVLPWIELLSEPTLQEKMRQELDGYLKLER